MYTIRVASTDGQISHTIENVRYANRLFIFSLCEAALVEGTVAQLIDEDGVTVLEESVVPGAGEVQPQVELMAQLEGTWPTPRPGLMQSYVPGLVADAPAN